MKKLSKQTKQARGTLRKSREVKNNLTFEPLQKIPKPQCKIEGEALKYFEYVCELLISNNVLTAAHIPDITLAAYWWGVMTKAMDNMEKHGYTQPTKNGYNVINAHITVFGQATKKLQTFSDKYGFNLLASQKIDVPEITIVDDLQKLLDS